MGARMSLSMTLRPATSRTPFDITAWRSFAFWQMLSSFTIAAFLSALVVMVYWSASGRPTQPTATVPAVKPQVEEQRLMPVSPDTARELNAERPVVAAPLIAARAYRFNGSPEARSRATDCLAAAAWYEAGNDAVGEKAVMQVVLNRARHPAFPASLCGVVFQGAERTTGCQFTFTCDGSLLRRKPSGISWANARALAATAISGTVDRSVGLATHYHADYVVPYWASSLDKAAQIGPHLFYRWRGFWGLSAAFQRKPGADEPVETMLASLSPAHVAASGDVAAGDAVHSAAPAPLAAAPPPALVVEGVREKSLRGAVVRGQSADVNHFFLQLDATTFPGNYATAAIALCRNRPDCAVLGWRDASQMGESLPLSAAQRASLSFYFVQHATGEDKALWNCRQMPRSNPAQCIVPNQPITGD